MWQLAKTIPEMKSDTEQKMKYNSSCTKFDLSAS